MSTQPLDPPSSPAAAPVPKSNRQTLPATPHRHAEYWHTPRGRAIREVVFGMNDGLITTIGFITGIATVYAQSKLVLVAGIFEMFAGAVSMFFGAYLSTKSQREYFERELSIEAHEIEVMPEKEIAEMREIYANQGFTKGETEILVNRVTADKDRWLDFMAKEELGIVPEALENSFKVGATMGLSFLIGALPPLLPFAIIQDSGAALKVAGAVSLCALFAIGIGRSRVTQLNWIRNGIETAVIGLIAAAAGYALGHISVILIS